MTDTGPGSSNSELDLRTVVSEIYAEVDERRRSGSFPPGLERELDGVFARFAPEAAVGDDLRTVIDRAERAAFIDVDVPTASRRAGVGGVKKVLRKSMSWYLNYLARQVSAMGSALVHADRLLAKRIAALEGAVPGANEAVLAEQLALVAPALPEALRIAITGAVAGVQGRVLVASCGDGTLVEDLVGAGLDAYGTEPRRALTVEALRRGVDVRDDDPLDHLSRVGDSALAAVVLVDVVDTATLGVQLSLADTAARSVASGGTVVVVASDTDSWALADPVRADLAAGRPLRAETWVYVLRQRGLEPKVSTVAGRSVIVATRP